MNRVPSFPSSPGQSNQNSLVSDGHELDPQSFISMWWFVIYIIHTSATRLVVFSPITVFLVPYCLYWGASQIPTSSLPSPAHPNSDHDHISWSRLRQQITAMSSALTAISDHDLRSQPCIRQYILTMSSNSTLDLDLTVKCGYNLQHSSSDDDDNSSSSFFC